MSQTVNPRTQRSTAGMIGAMIVTVVVVVGWVGFRGLTSDQKATPVQTVEWATWVKSGRADHKLQVLAPPALPKGWRATSAEYDSGVSPHWHLGMLTSAGRYVGIEESHDPTVDLVSQYVDPNATEGSPVTIAGVVWKTYTDAGGDYALVRTLTAPDGQQERIMIVGAAPAKDQQAFAATLTAS